LPPPAYTGAKREKGERHKASGGGANNDGFCPFRLLPSFLSPGTVRTGAQGPQGLGHFRHHVGEFLGLRGRNPLNPEALRFQAEVFQHHVNSFRSALGFFITFQVMTFAQVSPADQDAVGAFGEGVHHQVGVDHARTHYPDNAAVGGILNPGDPGQVRPGIGTPVAAESDDQRFVLIFHVKPLGGQRSAFSHQRY
jgi:hypothetical protein